MYCSSQKKVEKRRKNFRAFGREIQSERNKKKKKNYKYMYVKQVRIKANEWRQTTLGRMGSTI
jgi:hypothetical protein